MRTLLNIVEACPPFAPPVLDDRDIVETAALFAALGARPRVRLVKLLASSAEPVCLCHLGAPLGLSESTVSQHLKRLVEVGLVDRETRGKQSYFSINRAGLKRLDTLTEIVHAPAPEAQPTQGDKRFEKQRSVKLEIAGYAGARGDAAQGTFRMTYNILRMKGETPDAAERLATESVRAEHPGFIPARVSPKLRPSRSA